MRKTILALWSLLSLSAMASLPQYLDETLPVEQRVEDLLPRLTLDEKFAIIHAQSKFSSAGVARLGIPTFWTDDGPHGVRPDVLWDEWEQAGATNDSCVAFPALTCLAATWNPALAHRYGVALGEEARYRGKDMILGPGVNIYRTPLGGRNFEYMGEDPYLASVMVAPYVQGLQSQGVSACVKHYALNNHEAWRHQTNVIVDERTLHEIYLPAFKAAVQQGHAWGIMGAYNFYQDFHNCHNPVLLNDILKRDWGFDGVVVSDWGGTHDVDQAITCGLDMEFGTWTNGLNKGARNAYDNYYLALPYKKLVTEGKYSTRELNEKVRRVLRLFMRTTLTTRPRGSMCSAEHYATARDVAGEGIVLLQNRNNALPLDGTVRRVLVVGENAIKMMTVGGGSSSLKVQHEILPLEGIRQRLQRDGIEVDYARGYVGDTTGAYNGVTTGQDLREMRSAQDLIAEAVAKARQADAVIVCTGLNKSAHQDAEEFDRLDYGMPYGQDALVEAVAAACPRTIVVNISGNAVAMPWTARVPAIVQAWFLGSETGVAIAQVLMGDVNPSGKLPFTWPASLADVGAHRYGEAAYPGIFRPGGQIIDVDYKEGLWVGYRGVSHYKTRPTFAFGHGESYTKFALGKVEASARQITANDSISFAVDVKNVGQRAGAEVVQLYITDVKSSVERPAIELKGFEKVYLQPGETRRVTITVGRDALSFYDPVLHGWRAEPGDFIARVGTASDHLTSQVKFTLK